MRQKDTKTLHECFYDSFRGTNAIETFSSITTRAVGRLCHDLRTNWIRFINSSASNLANVCGTIRFVVKRFAVVVLTYWMNKINIRRTFLHLPSKSYLSIKKGLFSYLWMRQNVLQGGQFVCTYNPAAPGSSPKHTIYAFIVYGQICAIFVR